MAKMTGFDDGEEETVLNLTVKTRHENKVGSGMLMPVMVAKTDMKGMRWSIVSTIMIS